MGFNSGFKGLKMSTAIPLPHLTSTGMLRGWPFGQNILTNLHSEDAHCLQRVQKQREPRILGNGATQNIKLLVKQTIKLPYLNCRPSRKRIY